jgi:hypothetical protein
MAADTVTETTKSEVKEFTLDEISKHQSHDDCWLIIGNESNGMFIYESICSYMQITTAVIEMSNISQSIASFFSFTMIS